MSILMLSWIVNAIVLHLWPLIQSSDWSADQIGLVNLRKERQSVTE